MSAATVYLFRNNDLRLQDNKALKLAQNIGNPVIFVACLGSETDWQRKWFNLPAYGEKRINFKLQALMDIDRRLAANKASLKVTELGCLDGVKQLIQNGSVSNLVAHEEVGWFEELEQSKIEELCRQNGVKAQFIWDTSMLPVDRVLGPKSISLVNNKSQRGLLARKLPNMFTPFRKTIEKHFKNPSATDYLHMIEPIVNSYPFPVNMSTNSDEISGFTSVSDFIKTRNLEIAPPNTSHDLLNAVNEVPNFFNNSLQQKIDKNHVQYPYIGGETAGKKRMHDFIWRTRALHQYKNTRNRCLGNFYSSKFSLWLAHGCISAREVVHECAKFEAKLGANVSTYWLIFELLWRDFTLFAAIQSGKRLFDYGGVQNKPEKWFSGKRKVHNRESDFEAWCTGTTGFPFVDANMRELVATGWMSNRGRQNVASFLVYQCNVDWRWGAEFFEHHLIDHNVAQNYVNWQTIAGIGWQQRDNVFNVIKQSVQYEPTPEFILKWIPELEGCPQRYIHTPWEWSDIRPGSRYANPIRPGNTFFYESDQKTHRNSQPAQKHQQPPRKHSQPKKKRSPKSAEVELDFDF